MPVPADIVALMTQHPLETPEQTQAAADGSLHEAAALYGKHASDNGADWGPWLVWLKLGEARGKALAESIEALEPQGRRWLGRAAFEAGKGAVGLVPYERYLQAPGEIGPFGNENVMFFDALADAGRGPEGVRWADELESRSDDAPREQLWAARFQLAAGQAALARARVAPLMVRHQAWAAPWAVSALIAQAEGDARRSLADAEEAAKRELRDEDLIAALRALLGAEWERLAREHPPLERVDYDKQLQHFKDNPPLVPAPSEAPQAHWFGGADLAMPACKGCGHEIHQWFSFEVRALADLTGKLPSWTRLPFLGCADCLMWMARHDYVVDEQAHCIELTNVALSEKKYGKARWTVPALERRYAELGHRALDLENGFTAPMVGGLPYWEQSAVRLYCPGCRKAMVYFGAMATPEDFDPPFVINNETGFQLHFACDACHRLSVIAQFS